MRLTRSAPSRSPIHRLPLEGGEDPVGQGAGPATAGQGGGVLRHAGDHDHLLRAGGERLGEAGPADDAGVGQPVDLARVEAAPGKGHAPHGRRQRRKEARHDRVEEQHVVPWRAQVHRAGEAVEARARAAGARRSERGARSVLQEHERQRSPGLEVRRPEDQLAETGLAQVLGSERHVPLRRAPSPRGRGAHRRAARHLPEGAAEAL